MLLSGIHYQGFGLGSAYQVSEGQIGPGSQMTLWSGDDLIREKPDSLTQVFFVSSVSDASRRTHFSDEKKR